MKNKASEQFQNILYIYKLMA